VSVMNRHQRKAQQALQRRESRQRASALKLLGKPTDDEKAYYIEQAQANSLTSAYYHGWQIAQICQAVSDQRDAVVLHHYIEEVQPIYAWVLKLESTVRDISGYVKRTPGKLWTESETGRLYPFSEEDAGDLAKYYTQLLIIAERLGVRREEFPDPTGLIDGIRKLINHHPDGEQALRDAVSRYRPFTESELHWLSNVKLPGKPRVDAIGLLCARAETKRAMGLTWEETADSIDSDFAAIEDYSDDILAEVNQWNDWKERGTELDNLRRNFTRRPKTNRGT
jgi:hypothetical protein